MIVSFVIPVYNVEAYLEQCVVSVMNQGLSTDDYEIILVNDGSTDSSLDICLLFERQYKNIHVVSQTNKGIPATRNEGIRRAQGKWICFADSDDYLTPGAIGNILKSIKDKKAQLIRYWSIVGNEGEMPNYTSNGFVNFEGTSYDFIKTFGIDTYCSNYLYDREWLEQEGVFFEPYPIAEDYLFISKLLLKNPLIISTTYKAYVYIKHKSSITGNRSREHTKKLARAYIPLIRNLFEYASAIDICDSAVNDRLLESAQSKMRSFLSRVLSGKIKVKEFRHMIAELRSLNVLPIEGECSINAIIPKMINFICSHAWTIGPIGVIYRLVFIPLIYPHINKN